VYKVAVELDPEDFILPCLSFLDAMEALKFTAGVM